MAAINPNILPRSEWGANPLVTPAGSIAIPTPELWLHHSAGEQFDEAGMRMLQSFTLHRTDANYVDLEYSWVLDHVDCKIFESRGVGKNSAATFDHNNVSHAICVMGNFQTDWPSATLIHTLANLVAWAFEHGWIQRCAITGGHRDASGNSTACPGDHLEAAIPVINALALQIHAGTTPVGVKVQPRFSPALPGIVDVLVLPGVGVWGVSDDGGIFTFAGNFYGTPHGKAYFAGRHGARIVKTGSVVAGAAPPQGAYSAAHPYEVIATSGERYGCGGF